MLVYVHVHVCVQMCACMHVYCVDAYGHVHTCIVNVCVDACCPVLQFMDERACVCTHVLHACVCVCAYTYVCECIYVCLYKEIPRVHTRFPLCQLDRNMTSYTVSKFPRHTAPGNIWRFEFENSSFKYHFAAHFNV